MFIVYERGLSSSLAKITHLLRTKRSPNKPPLMNLFNSDLGAIYYFTHLLPCLKKKQSIYTIAPYFSFKADSDCTCKFNALVTTPHHLSHIDGCVCTGYLKLLHTGLLLASTRCCVIVIHHTHLLLLVDVTSNKAELPRLNYGIVYISFSPSLIYIVNHINAVDSGRLAVSTD